jgi:tetratricopeptide (TPR) repeat protein
MSEMMTPDALAAEGKAAYAREDFGAAAQAFSAAEAGYRAAGDAVSAAEMANNRSVVLLQSGDAQGALDAVGDTPDIFGAAGDLRRKAMALGNRGAALADLRRKEEAEKVYWESAQIFADLKEKDLRAAVLQSISRLQMGEGRYMEAIASMESGLEEVEKPSFVQRALKRLLKIPAKLLNRS